MKKPKFLYHASSIPNIKILKPYAKSVRDPNEGLVIFATPNFSLATTFLVNTDDSWANIDQFNGVFYITISDENRFHQLDHGGVVYTLPSTGFYCNPHKDMGNLEWTCKTEVIPIKKQYFNSGLDAMLKHGIQVYFVNKKVFSKIKQSTDNGFAILKSLSPIIDPLF